jgi:hypothetical protein
MPPFSYACGHDVTGRRLLLSMFVAKSVCYIRSSYKILKGLPGFLVKLLYNKDMQSLTESMTARILIVCSLFLRIWVAQGKHQHSR